MTSALAALSGPDRAKLPASPWLPLPPTSRCVGGGVAAGLAVLMLAGSAGDASAWFLFDDTPRTPVYAPERDVPKVRKPKHRGSGDARAQKTMREKLPDRIASGLLHIVISIDTQRLTLYSNGVPVAHSMVATGVPGHSTPTGIFSVIEKQRFHRSNLYSDAPMPYMQRITWSGVALHEGFVPGRPASHGCIRMPAAFARQMWTTTGVGARVLIAHGDVTLADITHPNLFVPKVAPEITPPADVPVAGQPGKRADAAIPVRTAEITDPVVTTDAVELRGTVKDGAAKVNAALFETMWSAAVVLGDKVAAGVKVAEAAFAARLGDAIKTADAIATAKKSIDHAKALAAMRKAGPISVFVSRKEKKVFVRHKFTPLFEAPITITDQNAPLGTHLYTAIELKDGGAAMRWTVATMTPGETRTVAAPSKRHGRKNAPVDAAPMGVVAHAATPSPAAIAALDRIEMTPETRDRIAELLTPGASLIISDQGLGPETGRGTDFIVVTR